MTAPRRSPLPRVATESDCVAAARLVAEQTLRRWAADVDEKNRFPKESIQALHDAGLLGFFVPAALGGRPGNFSTFAQIAAILGEECLSTALIWAMHCQQVLVLVDHSIERHANILRTVAQSGALIASVTSEYGTGGDLLRAQSPLIINGKRIRVCRRAPVVSYGAEAQFYLITMRSGPDRPESDVRLVLLAAADGGIAVAGDWNAMGMRGTRSVPMTFDVEVNADRLVSRSFRSIALQSMVPAGHIGWTACWFGAARGAYMSFIRRLRSMAAAGRRKASSDLLHARIAELRMALDLIDCALAKSTQHLDEMHGSGASIDHYEDITHNIALNNLKVGGSRLAFSVVDGLVELSGLAQGYLKGHPAGLERVFRDLRSAPLMFHNDRLLDVNGKLALVESSSMQSVWQRRRHDDCQQP